MILNTLNLNKHNPDPIMNPESKRKILLVEDDPVAAAITSAMLKHNGYDVVTVAGGTRAIESISNDSSIELILMDIDLGPGMSGPDAAREILKTNDIPIVFLTSHSEREMVYKVRAITRYGYVIKNSGDFVLLSSIEMAFELFESHMKLKKTSEQLAESEQSIRRKLDSILKPEIDLEDVELADLIDKEALQSLIDKFYMLTGFGIGIIDLKGKVLVAAGWQDICVKFHRSHPETLKHCIESDTILSAGVKEGEYKFYKCKNNLWDIVTPIMVEGRHVGNIFLGQFFFEDEMPDKELFIKQAGRYGFNERDYMDALGRVPKWSRDTVNNVMDYYTGLAGLIKNLSYGNIRLARALAERDRVYDDITRKDSILKMITDNMSDLIFIINKDGIYNYVSPSFSRVLGYNPSELEGRFAFEYVHEEDLPAIKSSIDDLYSKGTAKVESRYRDKYGNYSWYETSANVIRNSDGSITGAVVAGRSINDRKEADLKLRESEEIFSKAFNSSPLIMALSDLDTGRYLKVNDNFCRLTGFTKEDSIGKTSIEIGLLKEDDRKKLISHITQSGHIEGVELALYRKNGEMMRTVFSGEVITIAGEKMLLSIVQDVTSHKTALEKLEQSEGRYKLLVENSPLSIFLVRDGRYIYANPAAALRLGYSSPDEITGLEVEKTISPDSMELIRHRIKNAGNGNQNQNIELHLHRKDGSLLITESLSLPITLDDGPAILVIGNDVTRERCMQMELVNNEEKYRTIANFTYDWEFWIGEDGRIKYMSPSCLEISGYSAETFINNPSLLSEIVFQEDKGTKCFETGGVFEFPVSNSAEYRIRTKSGGIKWIAHVCRAVYDRNGKFTGRRVSNRDVTERHEMEVELFHTYDRLEQMWNIARMADSDLKTISDSVLAAIVRITGSPYGFFGALSADEKEIKMYSWSEKVMNDCKVAGMYKDYNVDECGIWVESIRQRREIIINDYSAQHPAKKGYPEGHVSITRFVTVPVFSGGKIVSIAGVANRGTDYSEKDVKILKTFLDNVQIIIDRKKDEDEIKSLLEQKEMLLREVHHRIKNNMNTVAGLLKLQSLSIEEPAAIEALNDARGRVQNMMLIYDRLYRSADYKNLNVKDYFENLVNEIIKLFPNHSKVNVVKKIDDFKLDSKVLFTMGIMINELITNTFKYAFDETDNPELAFSLSFNDGRVSFAVKDNGPGLPDNVKTGNRNGFGLNLVSSLAEQLEGEMVFGDTPGTEIKVSFTL